MTPDLAARRARLFALMRQEHLARLARARPGRDRPSQLRAAEALRARALRSWLVPGPCIPPPVSDTARGRVRVGFRWPLPFGARAGARS